MDMNNMKVQSSRNGKALGIGRLLASAYSASAPLDPTIIADIIPSYEGARLEER